MCNPPTTVQQISTPLHGAPMDDLPGLDKLLGKKLLEKVYDDALSPAAKEAGKALVDLVKTARMFTAPFQLAATFQERFEKYLRKAAERVPPDRQIAAPAEIIGPAVENMRHLNSEHPLWQMFEEVLTRSIDKDKIAGLHPSFVSIIPQLSRDEAFLIYRLMQGPFAIVDTLDLAASGDKFENRRIEQDGTPIGELYVPEMFNITYEHLHALGVVNWPVGKQEPIHKDGKQVGVRRFSTVELTAFGKLFAEACIPTIGFE